MGEKGCGAILVIGRVTINPIVVAEQMGVTGTGSTRWRRYNSVALPHGVRPYWARGPAAHFGFDHFFRGMIFGQEMAKIRHGGRKPYGRSVSAILGGCSVWFVIFGGDVNVGPQFGMNPEPVRGSPNLKF